MLRNIQAYVLAVLAGYVAGSIACTQSVMARLAEMGVSVPLGDRLVTTGQDILGMASSYLPIIAIGYLIAFPVAALVLRVRPAWRNVGYPLAGGAALLVIHVALELVLGITAIAAVRTVGGLALQVACGALGGYIFLLCGPARRVPD